MAKYGKLPDWMQQLPIEYPDSAYWRGYFDLPRIQPMEASCDRPDCPGVAGWIPGFQAERKITIGKHSERLEAAEWYLCPLCHRETHSPALPGPSAPIPAKPAPAPLTLQPGLATVRVVNLGKQADTRLLSHPGLVYCGRLAHWRGHTFPTSPVANPYKIGRNGDRHQVCELFLTLTLNRAMEDRRGPTWEFLFALGKRLAAGEELVLACWCAPERCHAVDLAAAIRAIALEVVND